MPVAVTIYHVYLHLILFLNIYIHIYIYIYIYIYTYIKYYIKQIKIFPSFNLLQAPERHCCLYEAMDPSNELQL